MDRSWSSLSPAAKLGVVLLGALVVAVAGYLLLTLSLIGLGQLGID